MCSLFYIKRRRRCGFVLAFLEIYILLIEETGLFIIDTQLAVYGCQDALHLSEGKHTAQERIASIMTMT